MSARSTTIPTQLIENKVEVDRVVLVGAPARSVGDRLAVEHLAELERLTDTAGGTVEGTIRQYVDSPNSKTYIGKGKAQELRDLVAEVDANLVIFDEELSPAQGKNLEEITSVRVMDRAELILDIFATRARTRESKMQVELAQLQYLLPRLKRMWTHLSRIRGGIGLRGPGETQLESDRRLIGRRISDLRSKLRTVAQDREVQRRTRAGQYRVALVGYTNAGKSSLLNALSGSDLLVEDRLFATLDATTRAVDLGDGFEALVTDTVGFIRKLPHHLVASFRSTLEEAREADVLLHVLDVSHPDWEEQREVVNGVLDDLELGSRPQILVFNKIDRLGPGEEDPLKTRTRAFEPIPAVFVSAHDPKTLDRLTATLKSRMRSDLQVVDIRIPIRDGGTLSAVYREGEVIAREDTGEVVCLTARTPEALLGRLEQTPGVEILISGGET